MLIMGPYTTHDELSVEENYDRQLAAARAAFPDYEFIETLGGVAVVPATVELLSATTVDGVVRKLREREG
jgi:hypothetical protein